MQIGTTERGVVLGFYRDHKEAKQALQAMRRSDCNCVALLRRDKNNKVHVQSSGAWLLRGLFIGLLLGLLLGCVLAFAEHGRESLEASEIAGYVGIPLLFGTLAGWFFGLVKTHLQANGMARRFSASIVRDESLLVSDARNMEEAVETLRETGTQSPAIFVFRPKTSSLSSTQEATSGEVTALPLEKLRAQAARVAGTHSQARRERTRENAGAILLQRLRQNGLVINSVKRSLSQAAQLEQSVSVSGEWLLDNSYLIQAQVKDVRLNLTREFYRDLPLLPHSANTPNRLPRVYVLSTDLVTASDARLDRETLVEYLNAYQSTTPLLLGELWAVPLMLRLALIERLRLLVERIDERQRDRERADFWANRLRHSARRDPDAMVRLLAKLAQEHPQLSPHFADRLRSQLLDEEAALSTVQGWLERKLEAPLSEIISRESRRQITDQLSIANIITSLRALMEVDWREIFEETSRVHHILSADPSGVYTQMDFASRDRYRHAVEEIARWSRIQNAPRSEASTQGEPREMDVARMAVSLATQHHTEISGPTPRAHIGYYLVDDGRADLESPFAARPTFGVAWRRWAYKNSSLVYIGGIALITFLLSLAINQILLSLGGIEVGMSLLIGALLLLPASEFAVQIWDYTLSRILPPRGLPKMQFEDGVPQSSKTLVVVPMMLSNDGMAEDLERLEVRHLANNDEHLQFALVADFTDANQPELESDTALVDGYIRGVEALNAKHGDSKFLLFLRPRRWSPCENKWIGWERKRGKLEELNEFLSALPVGSTHSEMLKVGNASTLAGVRYVITLDADTQLPHGTARRMIETLAHPLNTAVIGQAKNGSDPVVTRGYGIIQPLVSTALPSAVSTRFTRLFTDARGTDPYTHLISNVYQDLSGEGAYHGKGIYDLRVFQAVLGHRFPEATLLSHDLLEGSHIRVGLATDIELFDQMPANYLAYAKRAHRWIRGDWQIASWVGPSVPHSKKGRERNPLSSLNRWKIFDNLRRSLVPVSMIASLLVAWFLVPAAARTVSIFNVALFFLPVFFGLLTWLTTKPTAQTFPRISLKGALGRAAFNIAMLPHQASSSLDAIVRVLYRRCVSKKNLLEWTTAQAAERNAKNLEQRFIWRLAVVSLLSLVVVGVLLGLAASLLSFGALESAGGTSEQRVRALEVGNFYLRALVASLPFILLWFASPFLVRWLSGGKREKIVSEISTGDRTYLRGVTRETWRYFDDFIGAQTNWLPPDNYQEHLNVEVAPRTSPTNIGLWFLSALAARDFGYITLDQVADRTLATVETLENLEKWEGHFLNWYDISTTEPLNPRYVSTVDSGNLLVSLWAFSQGVRELTEAPVIGSEALRGLQDTLQVFKRTAHDLPIEAVAHVQTLTRLFEYSKGEPTVSELVTRLREAGVPAYQLTLVLHRQSAAASSFEPHVYWADAMERQVASWNSVIDRYLGWAPLLMEHSTEQWRAIGGEEAVRAREAALKSAPSLAQIAHGEIEELSMLLRFGSENAVSTDNPSTHELPQPPRWIGELADAASKSRWLAGEMLAQCENLVDRSDRMADVMNLRPLYDPKRKLFSIGINLNENRLDKSYYDLLASECRLASFAAVARGDVPAEHWLQLRRLYGGGRGAFGGGVPALLSWSGTMFEYLMPLLLTKAYENSLLEYACRAAVSRQMEYGRKLGIPWGISEAAFSAIDQSKTYQYRAFGVPGLGIKRGLEEDLVVAPYATVMALMVEPQEALENLRRLEEIGMRGSHGFYESIDYTRARVPEGARGVPVRTFMVHHQGMSLLALGNVLCDNVMQKRFHADRRVVAAAPLLYEGVPESPPILEAAARDRQAARLEPIAEGPISDEFSTANTPTPRVHLLSNGEYSLMMTNAGGGYSRWRDFEITRWRSDTTRDNWGQWLYVRDLDEEAVWSATYQPIGRRAQNYRAIFAPDRAEFRRRDAEIETQTEIIISPEDDVEIRRVTLTNTSKRRRRIEVTSFAEIALAPHNADRAHPAFSKLFVQTEAVPERGALLATRRPRSPKDARIWAAHCVTEPVGATANLSRFEFETDRAKFIGRGRDASNPVALEGELSGTAGAVLDPVFSVRRRMVLEPGARVQLAFVTTASDSRERVMQAVEKYSDLRTCERAFEMAWNNAQLELYRFRLEPGQGQVFQQLASAMLYPHAQLRATERRLRANALPQSRLWAYGISGDLPIIAITIGNARDIRTVREAIQAQIYWRARGLKTDLVILNEEAIGYEQPLFEELRRMVQTYGEYSPMDASGGIFLRAAGQIPEEDLNLIFTVARVVLVASRGSLAQQMGAALASVRQTPRLVTSQRFGEEPSAPLPFLDLPYFNGFGGFTTDGREYAIYLGPGTQTPAPWINAIANEKFGAIVSESGQGFSWSDNSQANRLTQWNNDPVSDTASEAIYIRDEDTGTFWTPTPLPVRELDAYRARHGQGYSLWEHNSHAIEQELITFVPVEASADDYQLSTQPTTDNQPTATNHPPVRVQKLRLRNASSRRRKLSVTFYLEWILGTTKEETGPHIVTQWDSTNNVLLARNGYHPDFARRVSFVATSSAVRSYTADRTEFIGRNGHPSRPAAMTRQTLGGCTGAGLDACAAMQVLVEFEPGQEAEIVFVIGQAEDAAQAIHLARQYRDLENADTALHSTRRFWDETLNHVQVETPDMAVNFLLNRWLVYQVLSCRVWGRSALYQSGGAYGFRDQLQDVMALLHHAPAEAREHILRAAQHQFVEGDVQHWWHPPSGAGVRTRFSDDLLWLPLVVAQYVRVTGDSTVLDEVVPFIEGKVLDEHEHEIYMQPHTSTDTATILEHCRRAIEKGLTSGPHGLPLIGIGDWNDGMSRVGVEGRGESVWLAWFLCQVLHDFAQMLELREQNSEATKCREEAAKLAQTVEEQAWDGDWYRRAYFDDGRPLGSKESEEAKIDSLAQTWNILSGLGNKERAERAMQAVDEHLIREEDRLILLFTPPFDKSDQDPGYIKGYVPGVRENGGQYTHAAIWVAQAFARKGNGDRAVELLRMLNPVEHARTTEEALLYKVEPYVVCADVYALENRVGQGGWTWYTGSASWMYRVWLEDVLGVQRRDDKLFVRPCVPANWPEYSVDYRYGNSTYRIRVQNPDGGKAIVHLEVDGEVLPTDSAIPLSDDNSEHDVLLRLGQGEIAALPK